MTKITGPPPGGGGRGGDINVTPHASMGQRLKTLLEPIIGQGKRIARAAYFHGKDAPRNILAWGQVVRDRTFAGKIVRKRKYDRMERAYGRVYAEPVVTPEPRNGQGRKVVLKRIHRLGNGANAKSEFRAVQGLCMDETGRTVIFEAKDKKGCKLTELNDREGRLYPVVVIDSKKRIFAVIKSKRLKRIVPSDGNWKFKELKQLLDAHREVLRKKKYLRKLFGAPYQNPLEAGKVDIPMRKGYQTGGNQFGVQGLLTFNALAAIGSTLHTAEVLSVNPQVPGGLPAGASFANLPDPIGIQLQAMAQGLPVGITRKGIQESNPVTRVAGLATELAYLGGFAAWCAVNIATVGVPAAVAAGFGIAGSAGLAALFGVTEKRSLYDALVLFEKNHMQKQGETKIKELFRFMEKEEPIAGELARQLDGVLASPRDKMPATLLRTMWHTQESLRKVMEDKAYLMDFKGPKDAEVRNPLSRKWHRGARRAIVKIRDNPHLGIQGKYKLLVGLAMNHPIFACQIRKVGEGLALSMEKLRTAFFTAEYIPLFSLVRELKSPPLSGCFGFRKGTLEVENLLMEHFKDNGLGSRLSNRDLKEGRLQAGRIVGSIAEMDRKGGFPIREVRSIAKELDEWALAHVLDYKRPEEGQGEANQLGYREARLLGLLTPQAQHRRNTGVNSKGAMGGLTGTAGLRALFGEAPPPQKDVLDEEDLGMEFLTEPSGEEELEIPQEEMPILGISDISSEEEEDKVSLLDVLEDEDSDSLEEFRIDVQEDAQGLEEEERDMRKTLEELKKPSN